MSVLWVDSDQPAERVLVSRVGVSDVRCMSRSLDAETEHDHDHDSEGQEEARHIARITSTRILLTGKQFDGAR